MVLRGIFVNMKMLTKKIIIYITAVLLTLSGCSHSSNNNHNKESDTPSSPSNALSQSEDDNQTESTEETSELIEPLVEDNKNDELITNKINSMSTEEKVAQLFVVTPEALTGFNPVTQAYEGTKNAIDAIPVGGIIYMQQNLIDPYQTAEMLKNTYQYSMERIGLPIFLSVDEEGGGVTRVSKNPGFPDVPAIPDMSYYGSLNNLQEAYDVGSLIGSYLHELGFNLDFAPVADVLTNSTNTVIGNRAFSSDVDIVANMALQVAKGLESNNVYATYKHFPGHGGTADDTHEGYAYIDKTIEELRETELVPFQKGIDNGIQFMMIAHISLPNILGDNTPASLSSYIMTDLLRDEMGYKGLIITDALNMGAITNSYSTADACLLSFQAGTDLLLLADNLNEGYNAILSAVYNGTISEERLNASLERILKIKYKMMDNE